MAKVDDLQVGKRIVFQPSYPSSGIDDNAIRIVTLYADGKITVWRRPA